ncbi:hypothetical protein LXL04_010045 [Taraxacum kok-saghyz]
MTEVGSHRMKEQQQKKRVATTERGRSTDPKLLLRHIYAGRGWHKGPESGGCGNFVTRGSVIVFIADDEGGEERQRGSRRHLRSM